MKIIRKEDSFNRRFDKLDIGDCFEYDDKVYIKIVSVCHTMQYYGEEINCFCLTTNRIGCLLPSTVVRPLNVELREV